MSNEELIENLVKLNISSNERLGRVNEIVSRLAEATSHMVEASNNERLRTDRLIELFDKHVTELEQNRDLVAKECQRLQSHCDKITEMTERCQKMQSKLVDAIERISFKPNNGPINNIQLGDENKAL